MLKWNTWEPNNSQPSVLLNIADLQNKKKIKGCLMQHTCGKLKAVLLSPITAKESLIWLIWDNTKAIFFNQNCISYRHVNNIVTQITVTSSIYLSPVAIHKRVSWVQLLKGCKGRCFYRKTKHRTYCLQDNFN